jgi:hypothetical protein
MFENFCQTDPKWNNFEIPGTTLKLGRWGCAVCCLANVAKSAGKDENPLKLALELKFSNGSVLWSSLTERYSDISLKKVQNNPNWTEIDEWLKTGNPVIVKINISKKPKILLEHWVVIWDKITAGNYIVSNPLNAGPSVWPEITTIDKSIYRAIFYEIEKSPAQNLILNKKELEYLKNQNSILQAKIAKIKKIVNF